MTDANETNGHELTAKSRPGRISMGEICSTSDCS